jgi:hypothetical protein
MKICASALRFRATAVHALLTLCVLAPSAPAPLAAQVDDRAAYAEQADASRDEAPRVFIDCRRCDHSHFRREIMFVNHVRDPALAQVHVLITDEETGSGGRRYALDFIGREAFDGVAASLSYVSHQSDTGAQERDGLTRALALGLVPYVARTPLAQQLDVSFRGSAAGAVPVQPTDPWRNWTFEVYGGGNFSAESTQGAWNARYGFYANRVTDEWKVRLRPYFNNNYREIRREDSADIRLSQRRHGFDSFVIRSLGNQMGSGIFLEYITTTVDNLRHSVVLTPALEYSVFPYAEASRRQVTFAYRIGYELVDYFEETIYDKTHESLLNHSLNASVQLQQLWGSVSSSLTGSKYLHDGNHYRLTFDGNVSLRLGTGLSLNLGGSYQRIHDQLALPRGDASLEDILLQRRRLATSYRGSGNIGLSYTFGSIFTNVVNPRL